MTEWRVERLDEVARINPREALQKGQVAPFIDMASVAEGCGGVRAVSQKPATPGARFRAGDTLVARITPCLENGKIARVPNLGPLGPIGFGSTEFIVLRGDGQHTDSGFLSHFAKWRPFRDHAEANLIGSSGRQRVSAAVLGQFTCALPPLPEQRRIAGVLGAFDDLIETNQRTASSLESLASEVARQTRGSVALREIAVLGSTKQVRPIGDVDHFSIPAFDANRRPSRDHGSLIKSGKLPVPEPSVLVSRLNPITPRTWMAYPEQSPAVASTEFVPLLGRCEVSTEQVWAVTNHGEFWEQMRSTASGSTNSRQRVDRAAIHELLVPDPRLLAEDQRNTITTCIRATEQLRREAQDLATQRDELLPLLMSGKVRVADVEGSLP